MSTAIPPPKNWAGNLTYSTSRLEQPASVEQLQALVMKHDRIKVLGTRHCFNDIADSKDCLLSLHRLNKIIALDPINHTVTIEAGVRYGELATWLNDRGFALHNLASLPHISVAGGCATATHGSGVRNGNLSSAVRGMELITASGDRVELSQDDNKEIFPGAVVHLGGLGVITKITLAIEPAYAVTQQVYEDLSLQQLEAHFEEIMSTGYSVSLFTEWRNNNIDAVWIKSRVGETAGSVAGQTPPLNPQAPPPGPQTPPPEFFGATPATHNLHPIRGLSAEHSTEQGGLAGPWHQRLPHFRMGFTPSSGEELQSEYFIPRDRSWEAIRAIEQLHQQINPYLLVSEIRCIAADECWMSPCYRQPSTAIHFTWRPDWPAVSRLLPLIEQALAPLGAKPHWGKLFTTPHRRIAELYDKLPDFQQLLRQYDPKGKFRNDYLDKVIFGS